MKNRKLRKILLTICSAMLLVCLSVGATMAYLTSQDTVTNTFTVGKVKITLDEAKVGTDGKALTGESAERVKANSYKLMPGHNYDKDPTVHVEANSENCWVFVKVKNEISAIEDNKTIATQIAENGWSELNVTGLATNEKVYYKSHTQSDKATDLKVFATVKVKGEVTNDTLGDYANKNVVVTAYAIQADGFTDATIAWNTVASAAD